MIRFASVIFLSAFLLFQIQPIVAKYILPWFGGASNVWTICLVFFQVVLLLGYLYAHLLNKYLSPYIQSVLHCALVFIAVVFFLPIEPGEIYKPDIGDSPQVSIVILLIASVGLPYALISASGPLLQSWFQHKYPDNSTYRLYALSNLGSLIGLISYPFIVEPQLSLSSQTGLWSAGFALYFVFCITCSIALRSTNKLVVHRPSLANENSNIKASDRTLWVSLAAVGSVLLLATTNKITMDIASVPFLWILPLSIYLISFIICFDKPRWYIRRVWIPLLFISMLFGLRSLMLDSNSTMLVQVLSYSSVLLCGCMVCHGELHRIKPHAQHLTSFYLMVSLGGALGGLFVAAVAPVVFSDYWELQIIWITLLLITGLCLFSAVTFTRRYIDIGAQVSWTLVCVALSFVFVSKAHLDGADNVSQVRGFYGVLKVRDVNIGEDISDVADNVRYLYNGTITHGLELSKENKPVFAPTSYYGKTSGVGLAISAHPKTLNNKSLNVGVIGMGAATIAALCKHCQSLDFYEIDPNVIAIEKQYFSNLDEVKALGVDINVLSGDGRIRLENELQTGAENTYDILAVDAFSGDSIPIHLLTIEAYKLYWHHLRPDGVLAIHVSNRHLDLSPIVHRSADELNKNAIEITNAKNTETHTYASTWILITNNRTVLNTLKEDYDLSPDALAVRGDLWTDEYSNIFNVIR